MNASPPGHNRRRIDMRTDTCTLPTPEMYAAMATAPLGDDGWRDDPTVLKLEEVAADLLGKEAALFMPSGTMSDLVASLSAGGRGGDLIAHKDAWIIGSASRGGYATVAGLAARPIPGARGAMDLGLLAETINPVGDHRRQYTTMISLENTHTAENGAVLSIDHMKAVYALGQQSGIPVFLDGARLPHAAVALNTTMAALAQYSDCVAVSLCKALGAPAGSILAGSRTFIQRALMMRKLLGGAMRQSGLMAACALVALRDPYKGIDFYHRRANKLAVALHRFDPELLQPDRVETNLLTLSIAHTGLDSRAWIELLADRRVLVAPAGRRGLRLLTHSEVDDGDIDEAIAAFEDILTDLPSRQESRRGD